MEKKTKTRNILPKMARALGESAKGKACAVWIYQPKVPASMMKKEEKKDK